MTFGELMALLVGIMLGANIGVVVAGLLLSWREE